MSGSNYNMHVDTKPFRPLNEGRNNKGTVCTLKSNENSGWFQVSPGYASLFAAGVFSGGATVKFEISPNQDGRNIFDLWITTTKNHDYSIRIGPCYGRWEVVGGDGDTLVECYLAIGG